MNKLVFSRALGLTLAISCLGSPRAQAGTYNNNFNADPTTDPNFSLRPTAVWRPTGSYDGSGYISLTDATGSQNGTIVLPNLDPGAPVIAFNLKMKVRIGGGTARPADGVSISFADVTDSVIAGGLTSEEGTATGLSVNIDTWDNGNGDGPALDIKLNGTIVAHKRFAGTGPQTSTPGPYCAPVETDASGNPISLETDPAGTPAPGTWVDLEVNLSACGSVSVRYKGLDIFKDVVTGYTSREGRFVLGARTGGANDNNWIDDLQITTTVGANAPRVASALPAGNPGRDVSEASVVKFVIDYSGSPFQPVDSSVRLVLDGTDVTTSGGTAIVKDATAKTTTITHTPAAPFAAGSRHEAVLTFNDSETPAVPCTARNVFYVTPVVASSALGTTLFIEAEDFNAFDGANAGIFYDFGSPNGSYNTLAAKHDVDYHLAGSNPDSPLYRVLNPPNGISVPGTPDNLRAGVAITTDYKVGWNDAGDWYNYTRTFPNTTYKVYGRFASGGVDTHVDLSKVTSDPAQSGQTTVSLGTFDADATGGWDTFCFVPLRDRNGKEAIVRLNGKTTVRVTTLAGGNDDFNYLAFVPTFSPTLRPTVVSLSPEAGSLTVRDPKLKVVIADADTQVVAASIQLFLDGVELTPVTQTDTASGAEGTFQITTPVAEGSHTAAVVFADNDAVPVRQTNTWSFTAGPFKGGAGTLFIEAEDFNYSNDGTTGGLHANFGDPDCSLLGKDAILDVDYHEVNDVNDPGAVPAYRAPTGVEASKPGGDGFVRGDHVITCNYIVGWNDTGDWYNYTRDFGPSARYNVYARLASGGADENAELAVITSNPASPNQTKAPIGNFSSPPTGNWDVFHTVPLKNNAGNLASVRLGGLTTLRFTTGPGNLDFNYLAFVRADVQLLTPTVASVEPRADSDYARAPLVMAVIKDEDSAVVASSLKLVFDGADVTTASTIVDTPTGAQISYQAPTGSPFGTQHTVSVEWQDNQATPAAGSFTWNYREGIYNPYSNLFIESEDFNTLGGGYLPSNTDPFNAKGLYNGKPATHNIDYHLEGSNPDSPLYRVLDPPNGIVNLDDSYRTGAGPRPGFETISDYKVGWTDPGDWFNYTRNYGAGAYYAIYLRSAHGDAAATIGGRLDVVDDPTSMTQNTTTLGSFRAPATGGWDTFTFVPLKTPDGAVATVALKGVVTLRYTVEANGGDINYLMLCPLRALNNPPKCVAAVGPDACGLTFPGQPGTYAIALNNADACVTLDGSGSSDPDNDPLQFAWSEGPNAIGTGAIVTNCLPLGCHTLTLTVSDGQDQCTSELSVCVITGCEAVEQCIQLVDSSDLPRLNKRPLIATLKAACVSFDRGSLDSAVGQLGAFQNKVRAQVGRSHPAEAQALIRCAQQILDAVYCAADVHGNAGNPPGQQ
ncbi:MAG TPA: carbohydrate-binding protein [Verrucomicrobiae bacterium]|nr:carbohydrate-binding protein [Verrucomicrobiae bacterium]